MSPVCFVTQVRSTLRSTAALPGALAPAGDRRPRDIRRVQTRSTGNAPVKCGDIQDVPLTSCLMDRSVPKKTWLTTSSVITSLLPVLPHDCFPGPWTASPEHITVSHKTRFLCQTRRMEPTV